MVHTPRCLLSLMERMCSSPIYLHSLPDWGAKMTAKQDLNFNISSTPKRHLQYCIQWCMISIQKQHLGGKWWLKILRLFLSCHICVSVLTPMNNLRYGWFPHSLSIIQTSKSYFQTFLSICSYSLLFLFDFFVIDKMCWFIKL